jgi:hypothetical protein
LKRYEVSKSQEGSDLFDEMAKAYGKKAKVTPTVFIGDYMIEGYNGWITEDRIESALLNCTEKKCVSPQEKLDLYKSGVTSTTTTTKAATTTTTTTSTTSSSTTTSTTTSSTSTTTTSTTTSTTTLPPVEKKEDNSLLFWGPGAILASAALFAILRRNRR